MAINKTLAFLLLLFIIIVPVLAFPPLCILNADPLSGTAPLTVRVSEVSGDKAIVDSWYDFGDEQRLYHELTGEHTYDKAGEYVITLHVINEKGEEATDKATVVVTGGIETIPPTITPTPTPVPTIDYTKINEITTTKFVYEGTRTISDAITASALTKDSVTVLKEETDKIMAEVSFPYNVTKPEVKTTFRIVKYKCNGNPPPKDEPADTCGYWIEATRDGQEIYTNSPIWLGNYPYQVVISESFDEKTNEITQTVKEDPKAAIEATLQRYVEGQPLGKAVSYER